MTKRTDALRARRAAAAASPVAADTVVVLDVPCTQEDSTPWVEHPHSPQNGELLHKKEAVEEKPKESKERKDAAQQGAPVATDESTLKRARKDGASSPAAVQLHAPASAPATTPTAITAPTPPITPPATLPASPVTPPSTGDPMRDKAVGFLVEALQVDGADRRSAGVARAVEEAMFRLMSEAATYKRKYRQIKLNLADPKNAALRRDVLSGRKAPEELVRMSNEELANDELRRQRAQVAARLTSRSMRPEDPEKNPAFLQCPRCEERRSTYVQALDHTVTCVGCGHSWKI